MEIRIEVREEDTVDKEGYSYVILSPSFDIAEEKLGAIRRKVEGTV